MSPLFKTCPMCHKSWATLESFLSDPAIIFNGFQPDFEHEEKGLFYFTHETPHCGSSMLLQTEKFYSLHDGQRYEESLHLTQDCPGLCLNREELGRCEAKCKHAFVREISQLIMARGAKAAHAVA